MQPRIADLAMTIREAVESRDESAFHRFAEMLVGGLVELEMRQQEIQSVSQAGSHPDALVIAEMTKEGFRAQAKRSDELRTDMNTRFEALIASAREDARRQEKRFDEVRADMKADREEQAKRFDELRADMKADRKAQARRDRHRTTIMVSMLSLLFTAIGWLLVRSFQ